MQLLNEKEINYDFNYPESIKKVVSLGIVNLCPWWIMDHEQAKNLFLVIKKLYPKRRLIPFATRQDNDDVACFEEGKGEEVQIIHIGASEGWEQVEVYHNVYDWLKSAIDAMREVNLSDCLNGLG